MLSEIVFFYLVAALCVLFVSCEKSGFGSGIGVITTPMLTLVTDDPAVAAGILLPILVCIDWVALYFWWGQGSWRNYWLIIPGAAIGIALASLALYWMLDWQRDPSFHKAVLKQIIGWIALAFVTWRLVRPWVIRHAGDFHPRNWHGWLAGCCAGIASTFAHAGGPPVVIFLLPQKLPRQVYVGTTVALFTTINFLKLGPYSALGLINVANLRISLSLMPLVPLGVLLGIWANKHIREDWFVRVVYVCLTVIGLGYVTGRL